MIDRPRNFPPRSLKIANKVIALAHRMGVAMPMAMLTVPGRRSGRPRSTPVSPYSVDGQRYVVGGYGGSDWVRNARAAGTGVLTRGRRHERVRLVDLPESERGRILREFPVKIPHGVAMFRKTGVVDGTTPEAFEAAAPHCAVFRIEPV